MTCVLVCRIALAIAIAKQALRGGTKAKSLKSNSTLCKPPMKKSKALHDYISILRKYNFPVNI